MAVSGAYTYTINGSDCTITNYDGSIGGRTVSIPSTLDGYNVTVLGSSAFANESLTSVTIPSSVTSIGSLCFQTNNGLDHLSIYGNPTTTATSSLAAPFSGNAIGNNLTLTSNLTQIDDYMFYNAGLTSIDIPSSVTTIGESALSSNAYLTSVSIPSSVTSIGVSCFYNCIRLASVEILGNPTTTATSSLAAPFDNCAIGDNLTLTSNLTQIDDYMFYDAGITSVIIPSSVTTIGKYAFQGNPTLTSVEIQGNPTTNATTSGHPPFSGSAIGNNLTLTSNLTQIDDYMFYNSGLTSVYIPSSVTTIKTYAFANNTNLATFYVANDSVTFSANILTNDMSAGNKGTIYGGDPSNTKTWWTNNWTGTYNFNSIVPTAPIVTTTSPVTIIDSSSVTAEGNVTSDGGFSIRERGLCYGTSSNPTTSDNKIIVSGTTGVFEDDITGLSAGTTYHVRAYAINVIGTSYGADVEFSTMTTPTVTTTSPVTNITTTTVDVEGNVTSDGNATITERGFVYGFSANPTTANIKETVSGTTGAMSTTLTGLVPTSTYHVRAFATNSQGTSYGADVEFTMLTPTLAYYDGTYPVNPQWLPSGLTEMRLSWWSKLGQCMVKVKDHTNNSYFTLTDPEGGFGTSVTFDRNANWEPSPDMVSFDVSETGHNGCVDVRPEFYNMSSTEKLYINAPQLTWDRTKKWPQFYVPGKFSSATLLGEGIDDNETGIVGNSHTHSNKSNLDAINQDLATDDNVTFGNVSGSEIKGTTGKFGNVAGGNYSEFESDGTYKSNGTATTFEDLQFPVASGKVPAANFPSWETFTTNTSEYSFAVDDYIDLQANELFHKWKVGSTAEFHLHVTPKLANNTGSDRFAKFTLYIAYADKNEIWTETSLTQELTIPDGTGALKHFLLDMGDLALTNQVIGCQFKLRVKRIAATGGTEYASNVFITQVGSHLEQDTLGSRTEYTK